MKNLNELSGQPNIFHFLLAPPIPNLSYLNEVKVAQSCPILCDSIDCSLPGSSVYGDSPGKNTGMGRHSLFQGIIPKQGSNPGLLHCRLILYHLSHQGSPRILECIAYPFPRGSSWCSNWTWVSWVAGGFFTNWATREGLNSTIAYCDFQRQVQSSLICWIFLCPDFCFV